MALPADTSRPAEAALLVPAASLGAETAAIALGGAIGASLRYAVYLSVRALEYGPTWLPAITTFGINILGAAALGALAGCLESRRAHPLLRPFFGAGVFGSFTTFSGLVGDHQAIHLDFGAGHGALLLIASLAFGWVAYGVGRHYSMRNGGRAAQ